MVSSVHSIVKANGKKKKREREEEEGRETMGNGVSFPFLLYRRRSRQKTTTLDTKSCMHNSPRGLLLKAPISSQPFLIKQFAGKKQILIDIRVFLCSGGGGGKGSLFYTIVIWRHSCCLTFSHLALREEMIKRFSCWDKCCHKWTEREIIHRS
jgi:hypothetical protein